jgi:hypothetical protein
MQRSAADITDIWCRTPAKLVRIVEALGLSDAHYDAEDHWEWAIGTFDGVQLDVTRAHVRAPSSVETRIFRVDNGTISDALRMILVDRLRSVALGRVWWGRWVHRKGEDFELQAVGYSPDLD